MEVSVDVPVWSIFPTDRLSGPYRKDMSQSFAHRRAADVSAKAKQTKRSVTWIIHSMNLNDGSYLPITTETIARHPFVSKDRRVEASLLSPPSSVLIPMRHHACGYDCTQALPQDRTTVSLACHILL